MTNRSPISGNQVLLQHGPYSAAIASVGASVRSLRFDHRDLIVPFAADEVRPSYRGAILAPWPNRIIDGRYSFDGVTHELSITEPTRSHALHGLLAWQDWALESRTDSSLMLSCTLVAQQGYPFPLQLQVGYELGCDGLTTTVTALNIGPTRAPYGVAAHPYLMAGEGRVDDWDLKLPAQQVLQVTEDRLIPTHLEDVGSPGLNDFDFREKRSLGAVRIDHAFTRLSRDTMGRATVEVTGTDGTGTAIDWGTECPWVQIHTADLPGAGTRQGLAVEPMTCPPNAFNTEADTHVLNPGETHTARWTIRAVN